MRKSRGCDLKPSETSFVFISLYVLDCLIQDKQEKKYEKFNFLSRRLSCVGKPKVRGVIVTEIKLSLILTRICHGCQISRVRPKYNGNGE